jgi:SWI/SNF-related matrix-associated actin-dependent regulator 1 of chromatin subfamily A
VSKFRYNDADSRKRPNDDGDSSPAKKQKPMPRQNGPSRALPVDVDLTSDEVTTLNDIADLELRKKTLRLQTIYVSRPVKVLYEALLQKKGNFEDACNLLAEQDSDEELGSLQIGLARSSTTIAGPKKTAQRGLKAPVISLAEKYSKLAPAHAPEPTPTITEEPKKRRLMRGRRRKSSSSDAMTPPRAPQKTEPAVVVSDDEDEGIINISDDDDDSETGATTPKHDFSESKLLDFFNSSSLEAMVDLSGHKEDDIRLLFEQRPFESLDGVRKIHVDAQAQEDKGKKKPRKPRITFGARLVESAEDMWDAYSTIDSVVKQWRAWHVGASISSVPPPAARSRPSPLTTAMPAPHAIRVTTRRGVAMAVTSRTICASLVIV